MSRRATVEATPSHTPPRSSARLGVALRRVLLGPTAGFEAMLGVGRRRDATAAARLSEGVAPYALSAIGGVAAMLVWLKLGGLIGVRQVGAADFSWGALVTSLAAGALVMLLAQSLWAWIGGSVLAAAGDAVGSPELRMVWVVAAFPQTASLLVLLPLDLLIAGSASYGTTRPPGSAALTWAAVSIALGVALAAWSLYLFISGLRVATQGDVRRMGGLLFLALLCVAVVVVGSSVALVALAGATS